MAQVSKIDHISYGGVDYEFVDQTARDMILANTQNIYNRDITYKEMVEAEKKRAMDAEKALEDSKVSIVAGKGLSTNDFTDEYKNLISQPRVMVGATDERNGEAGVVPQPKAGDNEKYLKGDGTWSDLGEIKYSVATHTKDGLMSASDKEKLDAMDKHPDEMFGSVITIGDDSITEVLGSGKTIVTTFNSDGSITQVITKEGMDKITLDTVFGDDGTITRTRS